MSELDRLGEFLVLHLRDKALLHVQQMNQGVLRTPAVQALQGELAQFTEHQRDVVRRVVTRVLDSAMHDLLVGFQEAHDFEQGIELVVGGNSAAESSGMLHGEVFGASGWIQRFSRYPPCEDIAQ